MADEMREVEEELDEDSSHHDPRSGGTSIPLEEAEEGRFGEPVSNGHANGHILSPKPTTPSNSRLSPSFRRPSPSIHLPLSGGSRSAVKGKDLTTRMMQVVRGVLMTMTSPVFAQAFVLTFLGEWGDRSQITTIAMGGAHVRSRAQQAPRCQPFPLQNFCFVLPHRTAARSDPR